MKGFKKFSRSSEVPFTFFFFFFLFFFFFFLSCPFFRWCLLLIFRSNCSFTFLQILRCFREFYSFRCFSFPTFHYQYGIFPFVMPDCISFWFVLGSAVLMHSITRWRHILLRHSCWNSTRRYISTVFIICLDYELRPSIDQIKDNGFTLWKKARSRRYPAETITCADYADDIAFLANTSTKVESLLYSVEQAAGDIGFHVNTNKTDYMCFNREGPISTLNGVPQKLIDNFTYLAIRVSSTESNVRLRLIKVSTAIDRLSSIWKSDLSDEIKRDFFKAAVVSILGFVLLLLIQFCRFSRILRWSSWHCWIFCTFSNTLLCKFVRPYHRPGMGKHFGGRAALLGYELSKDHVF